jgi:hypothetical protein
MIEISFRIGGKEVKLDEIKDAMLRTELDGWRTVIANKLAGSLCDTHDRPPNIIVDSESGRVKFTVIGCCPTFNEQTSSLLSPIGFRGQP